MKDLLKIFHVKDDICIVDVNLENDEDGEMLAANLLALMTNGPDRFKAAFLAAAMAYVSTDEEGIREAVSKASFRVPLNQHKS